VFDVLGARQREEKASDRIQSKQQCNLGREFERVHSKKSKMNQKLDQSGKLRHLATSGVWVGREIGKEKWAKIFLRQELARHARI